MAKLFTKDDVIKLTDQNITHKWIVINPVVMKQDFKAAYLNKENQVVFATSGFGCKTGSLSLGGGKVYTKTIDGDHIIVHRIEVIGLATPKILKEMKIDV